MMMPKLGNPERAPYAKPARNGPFDSCHSRRLARETRMNPWSHDNGNSRIAFSLF